MDASHHRHFGLLFIFSSFVFRLLNYHFPNAGAPYHWSAHVIGNSFSRYQAWIVILLRFFSIPRSATPADAYALALVALVIMVANTIY